MDGSDYSGGDIRHELAVSVFGLFMCGAVNIRDAGQDATP